jgi:hypothetical protein
MKTTDSQSLSWFTDWWITGLLSIHSRHTLVTWSITWSLWLSQLTWTAVSWCALISSVFATSTWWQLFAWITNLYKTSKKQDCNLNAIWEWSRSYQSASNMNHFKSFWNWESSLQEFSSLSSLFWSGQASQPPWYMSIDREKIQISCLTPKISTISHSGSFS